MADSDSEQQTDVSPPESSEEDHQMRRRRRGLLRMYYGVDDSVQLQQDNPLDIDKAGFKADMFMEKMLKETSLNNLYKQEERMKKEIQELDSNMQYLVYENHSKFIKASETIREMKDDFQHLEDDMGTLGARMDDITTSSNSINSALEDRKKEISKLCGVNYLLKKLQFLFELPTRLTKCMEMGFYSQAVRTYSRARRVLEQYQHMPSFHGIQGDCSVIVTKLISSLKKRMDDERSSTATVVETVDLLLELDQPPSDLCQQFLANSRRQLERDLSVVEQGEKPHEIQNEDGETTVTMGIQEYVHLVCNSFFANVSLVIQTFHDLFIKRHKSSGDQQVAEEAQKTLTEFVQSLMDSCLETVMERLKNEATHQESVALIRALDKVSGKLQAMDNLLPSVNFSEKGYQLVTIVTGTHTECHSQRLQQSFTDTLMTVRHDLVTSKGSQQGGPTLRDHSATLYASIKSGLESALTNLKEFVECNVSFSERSDFRRKFCVGNIRAGVVCTFINFVLETCKSFSVGSSGDHTSGAYPPPLILILSKLVHEMERSTISYLVSYGDEKFPPHPDGPLLATPTNELLRHAKEISQALLNHYVKVQGQVISQMIRKSVETRDWLNTIEPRNIRSVMKRVVEEITLIDQQVGTLYEDGLKKEQGSESSRHTFSYQSKGYQYTSATLDSSLLSNIQKLFFERIEVFGTVQFDKPSIITGIIKIFLKALLECVRLRTFGKFGLQQMQVDCHYLQVYLWKFVSDEQLVRMLLEQVMASTIERCVEHTLMGQSVVELICERN
ncbi:vacuolar protein sorting-associated protein 51 homolog isoform X2 [Halichondria panicea]|uniref:vacuolar protein sorting-associated protein 51 homolog isoform X2 n=1 Tax=Halichondria panicea TaxID=6063 RepID=UPI00312BA279